ncbi:MAG: hypothetical protein U0172_02420 [Nitrospiraceae bacterium]
MHKPTGARTTVVHKQPGRIGEVRRDLEGKPCSTCGRQRYHLVLRGRIAEGQGSIVARCSHCQQLRSVAADLQRILWV